MAGSLEHLEQTDVCLQQTNHNGGSTHHRRPPLFQHGRFYDEVERVFTFGLDRKIGRNLNAFNDILRGGFGRHEYGQPIHIQWLAYEKASVISEKREYGHHCGNHFGYRPFRTTVPWNGFDHRKGGITMGLDIYAGTLTRYYSHNWKNCCSAVGGGKRIRL